jgi:hypothetical protein
MSGTDYGQAFALWREAAAEPWRDYSRHAFVGGCAMARCREVRSFIISGRIMCS